MTQAVESSVGSTSSMPDDSRRLIHSICPRNILSFGPNTDALELRGLNVLIGPNSSGKSNLVEVVAFLRTAASDLRDAVDQGSRVTDWIWKGAGAEPASVDVVVGQPNAAQSLRHYLSFREQDFGFYVDDERVEDEAPGVGQAAPHYYYRYRQGHPALGPNGGNPQYLVGVEPDRSILAQRRAPESYPELSYLADSYARIRTYRDWSFGRQNIVRKRQDAVLRSDLLAEDFSNLNLVLSRLRRDPNAKASLLSGLRDLYEDFSDFEIGVDGGTLQVYFTEGRFSIPAQRLSDGTLRYLCLLAILCDPKPPPLVCIEEPELGLHPDILPGLAERLVTASQRTQLIVTTHSDILVDAMHERPGDVVVCEKHEGQTRLRRLDPEALADWLEQYRLGQLWTKGQLGGNRW